MGCLFAKANGMLSCFATEHHEGETLVPGVEGAEPLKCGYRDFRRFNLIRPSVELLG